MPISMAARTRHAMSAPISNRPKSASAVLLSLRLPSVTVVAALGTMMPELRNPISAMKSPTPAATAEYSSNGMVEMISWRTPRSVSTKKATPEMKTAPSAACQGTPIPLTTEYVKYAFSPMPGASAMGYLAKPPIRKLPAAAERHVAAVTAARGMPVSCRMAGLTKTMYAIVMNVVNPARISVRQSAPSFWNSK